MLGIDTDLVKLKSAKLNFNEEYKNLLGKFMIRRKKGDYLNLPEKKIKIMEVELNKKEKEIYDLFKGDILKVINSYKN